MPSEANLKAILDKYDNSTFGIYGEAFELEHHRMEFERFKHDVEHNVPWVTIEQKLGILLPDIAYRIAEEGFNLIMEEDEKLDKVWGWSSKFEEGHEHQQEFEDRASRWIVDLLSKHMDFLSFSAISQHNPSMPIVMSRTTEEPIIKPLMVIYDAADGCTNLLNALAKLSRHYRFFDKNVFDQLSVSAGTCISFSHSSYPNFPFVTGYISYQNKEVITFLRQKYGDKGRSSKVIKGIPQNLVMPVSIRGSGTPKIIVPNYKGEPENYSLIGNFKSNIIEYFMRFNVNVSTDGESRTSAEDLRSLDDNQAMMYVDARDLLNTRAKLHLSDILAIGTPLNAVGWIMLHTEGNKIEEQRTEKSNINKSLDFLAINPYYFPTSLANPNPLDAVQYARMKLLQDDIKIRGITSLQETIKIGNYRFPIIAKEETAYEEDHDTIPDYLKTLMKKVNDLVFSIKLHSEEALLLFDGTIPVCYYGPGNEGERWTSEMQNIDGGKNSPYVSDAKLEVHKELDALRNNKILPVESIPLEILITMHAAACCVESESDIDYFEREIERKTGISVQDKENRPYKDTKEKQTDYLLRRQELSPLFFNKSAFHFIKAATAFRRLYAQIEEKVTQNPAIDANAKTEMLKKAKKAIAEKERKTLPMLFGGNLKEVEDAAFPKYIEMYDENLLKEIFDIVQISDEDKTRIKRDTIRQHNLDRYRAIYNSQRAIDYDPFNYHYLKQHAINFMLASRIHATRLMLEEAIELGHESGGWYPKQYIELHLKTFDFVPEATLQKLSSRRIREYYKMLFDTSNEDLVEDLRIITGELMNPDAMIKITETGLYPEKKYLGLWDLMKDSKLTSVSHIKQAIMIVQESSARDKYEALELLRVHIPRLLIVGFVGSGASRKVYKAYRNGNINLPAAVLLYSSKPMFRCFKDLTKEKKGINNVIVNEEEVTNMINHPHLVAARSSGFTEEVIGGLRRGYIECQFIDGPNLEQIMEHPSDISERDLMRYFAQIANALTYLHNKGYLHRDVKLDNIMIDMESDEARLVDLQHICRIDDISKSRKWAYASERYRDPRKAAESIPDMQTDIFAFATCLYYTGLKTPDLKPSNRAQNTRIWTPNAARDERFKVNTAGIEKVEMFIDTYVDNPLLKDIIRKGMRIKAQKYSSMVEMEKDIKALL